MADQSSEDDFAIIDEVVLVEARKVRLVPHRNAGTLALLREKEQHFLTWLENDAAQQETRIPVADISSMVPDSTSSTLLILTKSHGTWLFHFLRDPPDSFIGNVSAHLQPSKQQERAWQETKVDQAEDLTFSVFNSFAQVKQAYASAAKRLLGINEKQRRPRSPRNDPRPLKNPWIVEKELQFPPSKRLATPVSPLIWKSFHESDGSIPHYEALRQLIHQSGVLEEARADSWRVIWGLRDPAMSDEEYQDHLEELQGEFQRIVELLDALIVPEEVRARIDKDVFRTDRTVQFYHPNPKTMEEDLRLENLRTLQQLLLAYYAYDQELEYVQGMADLLSPILYVMRDETETFWIFVNLMKKQRAAFSLNENQYIDSKLKRIQELVRLIDPQFYDFLCFSSDSAEFFFCYRWLLVWFKREFAFDETLIIWEAIVTADTEDYDVFVAAAILDLSKDSIMESCSGLGEILAHLSVLSKRFGASAVLSRADQIYRLFSENKQLSWLYSIACK